MIFLFIIILTGFSLFKALKNKNLRYWKMGAFLSVSSLLCLFIGEVGTSIDSNGVLHEVGLILPVGGMLFVAAVVVAIFCIVVEIKQAHWAK